MPLQIMQQTARYEGKFMWIWWADISMWHLFVYLFYNDDNAQNNNCPKSRFNADTNQTWTNMNVWLFHNVIVFSVLNCFHNWYHKNDQRLNNSHERSQKQRFLMKCFGVDVNLVTILIITINHKFVVIRHFVSHSGFFLECAIC